MGKDGSYGKIAGVYDVLNADVDYKARADFFESAVGKFSLLGKPEIVLDLACGTGRMSYELALRGYEVIGVDGSEDMLSEAYERRVGVTNPLYLRQDMRNFELYGTVGAVVSCLDSVNYLTDEEDVTACFGTVHNYLEPGGLFIFDVSSEYRFKHIFADNSYILEDDDEKIFCGWQNYYNEETGICDFLVSIFSKEKDGRYKRCDESQQEKYYSDEKLQKILTDEGFETVGIFGDLDLSPVTNTADRKYFIARRI